MEYLSTGTTLRGKGCYDVNSKACPKIVSLRNPTLAPALDRRVVGYKASNKRLQEEEKKQPVHRLFRRWQTAAYGDLRSIRRTSRLREKATGKATKRAEGEEEGEEEEEEEGEEEETTNEEKEEERYVLA
ncbi:hypothetical protein K0M31_010699 [Melipona bicolor]|uniref:Uncharacterized protein n=1 Tax=Melipona bicolor TaxID=60889 RepID=A0AA40KHV0_9HYME|nr:hypothetical protein K0M31_010699 [Melipona bicolor]